MIALDTETCLILPGTLAPPLVCVSWADGKRSGVEHVSEGARELVSRALEGTITTANGVYDLAVILAQWPDMTEAVFRAVGEGRVHDVQIREKLIDLAAGRFRFEETEDGEIKARGYSLAAITARRLGETMDKDTWRLRYHDLIDTPISEWPEGARAYATRDAEATLEIHQQQEALAHLLRNEAAQVRAHWALHLASCWGIRTDAEGLETLEKLTADRMAELRPGLRGAGLIRPDDSRNTKAAVRRILEIMGEDARLTESGESYMRDRGLDPFDMIKIGQTEGKFFSVGHDAVIESGDQILLDYSEFSRCRSLMTGTIKDLRKGLTVPIQPRYEILVATGRTAASKPNIQNLRRAPGVRECFVPRDGNVFVACDYSAAELHTLAQTCIDLFGESRLADALNDGRDVHLWVGAMLGRMTYSEAVERMEDGDEHVARLRQLAKAANFGFPGGCSARRFVGFAHGYGVQITVPEAAKIKAAWLGTWTEMQAYFAHVERCVDKAGWHYVHQARADRLRSRCTYTSACNSFFQGLAADGAKAALWEVTREQFTDPDSPLFDTRICAFIHDEILIEVPEARAHDAAMRLSSVMKEAFNRFVPDCPTQAEPTVMRRWSKKAKPTFDEEGKLIPWQE